MSQTYILKGSFSGFETPKAIQMLVFSINGVPLDENTTQWFPLSQVSKIVRAGSGAARTRPESGTWPPAARGRTNRWGSTR